MIIKTCPFCGGNAALHSAIDMAFWIKCENCGASTQAECSAAAAIRRWNHRYTSKGMDLDKLFKNFCSYIDNMTEEEFIESLRRAEEETKDCWDMY